MYHFIAVTVPKFECTKLKVSGSDYDGCSGIFFITKEKASRSPSRPVYKKQGYDRFIFYYPGRSWFIGARVDLFPGKNGGSFFFKGKSFSKESLIELYILHIQYAYLNTKSYFQGNNEDDTEPWQTGNKWNASKHNNTVLVECLRD